MHALLVIDMQNGCFAPEPYPELLQSVIENINLLTAASRRAGLVIFVQHEDADDGLARGTQGWNLVPTLQRLPSDGLIEKQACDSFLETPLREKLEAAGIRKLTLCGNATDFCVDTTVRTAGALGFEVTVASDAHITRDRPYLSAEKIIEHHNHVWSGLSLPQKRFIRVLPTRQILTTLKAAR